MAENAMSSDKGVVAYQCVFCGKTCRFKLGLKIYLLKQHRDEVVDNVDLETHKYFNKPNISPSSALNVARECDKADGEGEERDRSSHR